MNFDLDCAGAQHGYDPESPISHRVSERATPTDGMTLLTGKPYIPAAQTDIQKTWRKFGWQPRGETSPPLTWPTIDKEI